MPAPGGAGSKRKKGKEKTIGTTNSKAPETLRKGDRMTFQDQYRQSLTARSSLPPGIPMQAFAGVFYEILEDTACFLPTVLSGGGVELSSAYKLCHEPMDCRMLLYTREGSGSLRVRSKTYALEPGTFLYMDCSVSSYIMEASDSLWRFTLYLVCGDLFTRLDTLVPFDSVLLHPLPAYSHALSGLERLLTGGPAACLRNKLYDAAILQGIVTDLLIEAYGLETPDVRSASYLSQIRQYLDTHFALPFRLEDLENRYHMSKYRICREFSRAYGTPPLKYLNGKRLDAAANLLLSTDKRIHEISLEVGFESTNHFINLFKRETGATPQAYRDKNRS